MALHNRLGKSGEDIASEYLLARGYTLRDVNWRSGRLELDIVAHRDNILVIVEVKTRRAGSLVSPIDAVTHTKMKHLLDAAEAYIRRYDIPFEVRFDVIGVLLSEHQEPEIEHIEDAFYPPLTQSRR